MTPHPVQEHPAISSWLTCVALVDGERACGGVGVGSGEAGVADVGRVLGDGVPASVLGKHAAHSEPVAGGEERQNQFPTGLSAASGPNISHFS